MGVNLNEIIEKALEDELFEAERRRLLLAHLMHRRPELHTHSRPGEQLRADLLDLRTPPADLATWLEAAAGLGVRHGAWFATQATRLRAGEALEHRTAPVLTTVGQAIELAVRFDRTEAWQALQDAAAHRRPLFYPAVGCDRQGVHLFLRRIGLTPPLDHARTALVRFDRSGDRAPPQTAGEWEANFAAALGATTLIEGIQRAGGPVFLLLGPLPADDLSKGERRGVEGFLTELLPLALSAASTPVLTVVGIDYPSRGVKPFKISKFRKQVVDWAQSAGFRERPDAPRYLLQTAELAIPEWTHADRLLLSEGVTFERRERIRKHYDRWRKEMNFEQIARQLKQHLNDDEEDA